MNGECLAFIFTTMIKPACIRLRFTSYNGPHQRHTVLFGVALPFLFTEMVLKAPILSGRSSGVEHNLAKVGVVSSNLIARSKFSKIFK